LAIESDACMYLWVRRYKRCLKKVKEYPIYPGNIFSLRGEKYQFRLILLFDYTDLYQRASNLCFNPYNWGGLPFLSDDFISNENEFAIELLELGNEVIR